MSAQSDNFVPSLDYRDEALRECVQDALAWPGVDGLTLEDVFAAQAPLQRSAGNTADAGQPVSDEHPFRISRWLVSCDSGSGWYPIGEFLAVDAATAIERAIEVFGPGAGYQAEGIPWDAAPLSKAKLAAI